MAVLNIVKNHFTLGNFGARIARNWVVSAVTPRFIQASSKREADAACDKAKEAVKQGSNEAKKTGEDIKNEATSSAIQMGLKTKEMADKATDAAQEMSAKAKNTAQNAWDTAKETAQKAKETVIGKADESKEAIKENVEKVKKCMDNKK